MLLLCTFSIMITTINGLFCKIASEPTLVQLTRVDLRVVGQPENPVPGSDLTLSFNEASEGEGWIKVTPPTDMQVYADQLSCQDMRSSPGVCTVILQIDNDRKVFYIRFSQPVTDWFDFKLMQTIDNPQSTAPTKPFRVETSEGESVSTGSDLELVATPGSSIVYEIEPNSIVVGESTTLYVTLTSNLDIPKGSVIVLGFPNWNQPEANSDSLILSYIQGQPDCIAENIVSSQMNCNMSEEGLIVEGAAPSDISKGLQIKFNISGFKNPIQSGVISGFTATTKIMYEDVWYAIDFGQATLEVTQYATLYQADLLVNQSQMMNRGVIQELNAMRLQFFLPVPLNAGCMVEVKLPSQYNVNTIETVYTDRVFGSTQTYSEENGLLEIDLAQNLFRINPCRTYIQNNSIATIVIEDLKHFKYVQESDSFEITIDSKADEQGNREKIARIGQVDNLGQINSPITFRPNHGAIELFRAHALNEVVQEASDIILTIQPKHSIFVNDIPFLIIELPSQVAIDRSSCQVLDITVTGVAPFDDISTVQCEKDMANRQLIIPRFLPYDYVPQPDRTITIKLGKIVNPVSIFQPQGLRIFIKATNLYMIDQWAGPLPWNVVTGGFNDLEIWPESYVAYKKDNLYTIRFSPLHKIPQNGYIQIMIPTAILIPDKSFSQSQCKSISNLSDQIICTFSDTYIDKLGESHENDGFHTLRILNAFRREDGQPSNIYTFSIPGIQNPIRTDETPSFVFSTFTRDHFPIDWSDSAASIQMTDFAKLKETKVQSDKYINSWETTYTVTMVPTVPILPEYRILIALPKQVELPETPICFSEFAFFQNIQCFIDETQLGVEAMQQIRVEFIFADDVQKIRALDRFSISIEDVRNPISTQTTDSFEVRIVDQNYAVINERDSGIVLTTTTAWTIGGGNVQLYTDNQWAGFPTQITIEFSPEHEINVGGGILIVYPPQVTPDGTEEPEDISSEIEVSINGQQVVMHDVIYEHNRSARAFRIRNIIQGESFVNDADFSRKITVKLLSLRNPFSNEKTDSFQVYSFNIKSIGQNTDDDQFFYIDKATQGLEINSNCAYPCKSCAVDDPSFCTECYQDEQASIFAHLGNVLAVADSEYPEFEGGLQFLQLGKCVSECATGRFYDTETKQCDQCDPTCLDCDGSATTCTACGVDDYLYLYNDQCVDDCPDGYLEDSSTNLCQKCTSPCFTCDRRVNKCTTCDRSSDFAYFFRDTCLNECKPEETVDVDYTCVECDSQCLTCEGAPDQCTTCRSFMKHDPQKMICTAMCEPEVQVFDSSSGTCRDCNRRDANCNTCTERPDKCTSCKPGYVLNLDNSCRLECEVKGPKAYDNSNQVAIDGMCKECESPCKTCDTSPSQCTMCIDDLLLFRGSCVQYCPGKWNPNEVTEVVRRCEYKGLVCPDNFNKNEAGDGCVPKEFECAEDYEINSARTACIPSPGSCVPFPFLLTSIFMSFIVLGSYLKDQFFTKVKTNLIALIGSFEIIMYFMLVVFSALRDWSAPMTVVFLLSLWAFVVQIAVNIYFSVFYKKDILAKDATFKKWLDYFPKMKTGLTVTMTGLNFKCFKIVYGGFFGLEQTQAQFSRHTEVFRLMRTAQYASFVFIYIPIFIADFIILSEVKFCTQLFVLGVETLALQVLLIILITAEMWKGSQALLQGGTYHTLKTKNNELKVRGGFMDDDDDYDAGVPEINEMTLIRSRAEFEEVEINMRKQALVKILNQVATNFTVAQKQGVDIGGDVDDVLTKFKPEQLKFRRAFSFTHFQNEDEWRADGDSVEEDNLSPRLDAHSEGLLSGADDLMGVGLNLPKRRMSWPLMPECEGMITPDPMFVRQVQDIKKAAEDYLIDNVYTNVKVEDPDNTRKKVKTVSRRTQTYLRELLTLEGEDLQESDMEVLMEEEAEIEGDYAANLISNVIEQISEDEKSEKAPSKKKQSKIKPVKKEQIPEFELADIMGDFEIDNLGNFIIIRGPNGELLDKKDRRVNRRGYLVDRFGNIINKDGHVIFKAVELDIDDEIPAPFGFEKRKQKLLQMAKSNTFKIEDMKLGAESQDSGEGDDEDDEDMLDKELQEIRDANTNKPSTSQQHASSFHKTEKQSSHSPTQHISHEDEQHVEDPMDNAIDEITKRKVPRKKKQLKQKRLVKPDINKLNNHPPRRIRQGDTSDMFPMINLDNDEQRRLSKIVDHIGGMASQLAEQQRMRQDQMQMNMLMDGTDFQDQVRLDNLKAEQLQELANDGNINSINEEFSRIEQDRRSFMIQDRPNMQNGNRLNSANLPQNRPQRIQLGHQQDVFADPNSASRFSGQGGGQMTNELQKVYGNIVDLTNLEEQHLNDLMQSRKPGTQPFSPSGQNLNQSASRIMMKQASSQSGSRSRGGRKGVKGLETIYLKKFNKSRMGQMQQMSGGNTSMASAGYRRSADPFRPLAHQYQAADQLLADTGMDVTRGLEPSVIIADRIDHIKRQYLTSGANNQTRPNSQAHLSMIQQQHDRMMLNTSHGAMQGNFGNGQDHEFETHNVMVNQSNSAMGYGGASNQTYDQQQQLGNMQRDNWVDRQSDIQGSPNDQM